MIGKLCPYETRIGFKRKGLARLQPPGKSRETAGTIAAHFSPTAITVVKLPGPMSFIALRRLQKHEAISSDASVAIAQALHVPGREFNGLITVVNEDEIIACTVHFGECESHEISYKPSDALDHWKAQITIWRVLPAQETGMALKQLVLLRR